MAILDIFRRRPPRGYVYVSEIDAGPMAGAALGHHVQIPGRSPPWIVVHRDLISVSVAHWPGRLWLVEIVDPISADDLTAAGHKPLRDDAAYTRAAGVKVLHGMPIAALFGSHGAQVCAVVEAATGLSLERALALADARHRDAGGAQTRMWKRWLSRQKMPPDKRSIAARPDLDGVLAVHEVQSRSPIGGGLLVLSGEVGRRAEAISGSSAWTTDDADPEGRWLVEPWSKATLALLDAALAFGASDFMSREDRSILATSWRDVIGADPG
jgi:hypothetical protein